MAISAKQQPDPQKVAEEVSLENAPDSAVVKELSTQVANAFVLYGNYKHYHWQTYGPLFRDLHKLFDELAEHVLETIDELAERVRMIGQNPPSHPMEIMSAASVSATAAQQSMRQMVEEANHNELIVIKEMRQAARIADDHGDPGTADVFARAVQVHEKHEWWLRDILKTGDGLCTPAE